jgi:hypothetical protein
MDGEIDQEIRDLKRLALGEQPGKSGTSAQ